MFGSGYGAIALQPYFGVNRYANYHGGRPPAFWLWSRRNDMERNFQRDIGQRPEFVVVSVGPISRAQTMEDAIRQTAALRASRYTVSGEFPGWIPWFGSPLEEESYLVLKRAD